MRERSDLPWQNGHTIPKGLDFDLVRASIVTFDFYPVPPRLCNLMRRLRTYGEWFDGLAATSAGPRARGTRRPKAQRS